MRLFERLRYYSKEKGSVNAFINGNTGCSINYQELWDLSDQIAAYIVEKYSDKKPIIVYGHKDPLMIASFLGCVKSGHPYCPVDFSVPKDRLSSIIEVSNADLVIATEEITIECNDCLDRHRISELSKASILPNDKYVAGEDVFYIIFTSGSTGMPKGVQITANCLGNYLEWMEGLVHRERIDQDMIILNQAPFSFDLSVMDLFTGLYLGGTVWSLDKELQSNLQMMFNKLAGSGISVWVSTPSFVNMCLINPLFDMELLPKMKVFFFCGEVLSNKTVRQLQNRFPSSSVINTYGPTESTVAVTEVVVSRDMVAHEDPLPIGYAKPGTEIYIMDEKYNYPGKPDGERGEIVIAGNTVGKGYLNNPLISSEKFFSLITPNGPLLAYKTGDEGYMVDGRLYYVGRMDFQIKINGYRIELGDIESNITRLENIKACVVLPIEKKGAIKGLAAFVTLDRKINDDFAYSQEIRRELGKLLPLYMVPKKFFFLEDMPKTNNGKVDRNKLKGLI